MNQSLFQRAHLARYQFPANRCHGSEHEQEVVWHLLDVMQLCMPRLTVGGNISFLINDRINFRTRYVNVIPQLMRLKQQPSFQKHDRHQMWEPPTEEGMVSLSCTHHVPGVIESLAHCVSLVLLCQNEFILI